MSELVQHHFYCLQSGYSIKPLMLQVSSLAWACYCQFSKEFRTKSLSSVLSASLHIFNLQYLQYLHLLKDSFRVTVDMWFCFYLYQISIATALDTPETLRRRNSCVIKFNLLHYPMFMRSNFSSSVAKDRLRAFRKGV